jgi:class 3 adenylate cyclase
MNHDLRSEFLNLRVWARRLSTALAASAHELADNFGNVISSRSPDEAAEEAIISLRGKSVARLRTQTGEAERLKAVLEELLSAELRALEAENAIESDRLLNRDLESVLSQSESESASLEEQVLHPLRLLRAHVWAERASVFGMLDGFTLEGIAALGWDNDDWKNLCTTAAGAAASTRKPYTIDAPSKDQNIRNRPGVEKVRNLVCFPILHGDSILGVLILANRVGGTFSVEDTDLIRRFANQTAHLLQAHIVKSKMIEFERAKEHLGKYLSQKVAQTVEGSQELFLGGVEKKVVCLFSDLRAYTTITEDIKPATLVKLLNFHFERMHAIIEQNEGTLDKIVGDLIMAVWNIPKDQPDPELHAMKAALEMQKEMIRAVIPEWQRHGVNSVGMGIGVNSGLALAGNLGSTRFMNYTVVGDAVNIAQRLESKAKAGEIWMNEQMFPAVQGKLERPVRRELEIRLKGKEQTINALVFKPLQY